jgi:HSP20 family protein
MDIVPKWLSHLPSRSKKYSELFHLDKFFDDLDLSLFHSHSGQTGLSVSSDEHHVFVEAHVPGLGAKDVEVMIDKDHILWIKGSKKEEKEDKKRKYYRQSQTSFSYCIPLWEDIDASKEPKATCKDGVMKLTFHRAPTASGQSRKIEVKEEG